MANNSELSDPITDMGEVQSIFCREHCAAFLAVSPDSMLGFALESKGRIPVNGLRHYPQGDTNGWYIWCGEEYLSTPDFFSPLHTRHVYEDHPQLIKFLGLAPGYRFLISGEYVDVWFDPTILNV